jgi:chromosome partitioning protein
LLDIPAPRDDAEADNIARHLIDRPKGDFSDLIHNTRDRFDVIPSHGMLETLPRLLTKAETMADNLNEDFESNLRLRRVLKEANIAEQYDTLIIDSSPTAGPRLYNAVAATQSLVVPIEATGKGMQAINGVEDMVGNLEDALNLNINILAIVPNGVGQITNQEEYLNRIRDLGYNIPVVLRDRSSLFGGCLDKQCTAFEYVAYHRNRQRDYEVETLDKLRELAANIEEVGAP